MSGRFFCVAPRDFSSSAASELAALAVFGGCSVPLAQGNQRNSLEYRGASDCCICAALSFQGEFSYGIINCSLLEAGWMVCTDYSDQVIAPIGEHSTCEEAA